MGRSRIVHGYATSCLGTVTRLHSSHNFWFAAEGDGEVGGMNNCEKVIASLAKNVSHPTSRDSTPFNMEL